MHTFDFGGMYTIGVLHTFVTYALAIHSGLMKHFGRLQITPCNPVMFTNHKQNLQKGYTLRPTTKHSQAPSTRTSDILQLAYQFPTFPSRRSLL